MSWGPWRAHDGKGCPVPVGTYCLVEDFSGDVMEIIAGCSCDYDGYTGPHGMENEYGESCWVWGPYIGPTHIKRYRIRKPKGLTILERIAEQPQDERVGA